MIAFTIQIYWDIRFWMLIPKVKKFNRQLDIDWLFIGICITW